MCDSHDSFQKQIANRYGAVWQTKIKHFARLKIKCKKLECDLDFVIKCRDNGLFPSFTRIKEVKCIRDYSEFFRVANEKLLRRVVSDHRRRLMFVNKEVYTLHLELSQVLDTDLWQVLDAMTYIRSTCIANKTLMRHNKKLNWLISKKQTYPHNKNIDKAVSQYSQDNNVVNLSSHKLSIDAERILSKGLNFAPSPHKIPFETIITGVEDIVLRNRVPSQEADCMRQDIASMLRKMKPPKQNINRGEMAALRELRNNENVLVLPADKGNNSVIVDTKEYESKICELISDTNTYKKVDYNPTARVTARLTKLLQASDDLNLLSILRPTNPTAPKIYGLPKIHKPNWPLRPIVSQIDAPTYKLSKHLTSILSPLTGHKSSYVRDSRHFVSLIDGVRIEPDEIMVSFDVTSLFTNIPVDDTMKIIKDLIHTANLPTEYIKWTEFCLKNGYFVWRGDYYLQVDGVAMGLPLAPVVANLFMEWFEDKALASTSLKPRYWWRYVDDVFAIVEKETLVQLTEYLNTVHNKIQFTVEEERGGCLSFLDVLVIRKPDGHMAHTVYRKPTHTDRYLQANSHHHPSHLAAVSRTLINRALTICDPQYIEAELKHVKGVLESNGYNWRQCSRWAYNDRKSCRPHTVERSPIYLPFLKGVTDKIAGYLKRRYDIKTYFRSPSQLRRILRSPKDKEPLNGPGVYQIPCDCGKCYIGETRRNISTRVAEHIRCVKNMDTQRSAVAEHAHTPDSRHYLRFDKVSVLAREKFFVPRKVREAIEISRYPNFNRDRGWNLPPAWKPVLFGRKNNVHWNREEDTASVVCLPSNLIDSESDSDIDSASDSDIAANISRAQPTERQLRAVARELRRRRAP